MYFRQALKKKIRPVHERSRHDQIFIRDVVRALNIDEYLDLPTTGRREVDRLLSPGRDRTLSVASARLIMDVFGVESATFAALDRLLAEDRSDQTTAGAP